MLSHQKAINRHDNRHLSGNLSIGRQGSEASEFREEKRPAKRIEDLTTARVGGCPDSDLKLSLKIIRPPPADVLPPVFHWRA